MKANKEIQRDETSSSKIFDERTVEVDYRTILPLLRAGLNVLDVGCGTGSISNGIAKYISPNGHITGIDNTAHFIEKGKETYQATENLTLRHVDLFDFDTSEKFDLIVSARTLQWLSNPEAAIERMKQLLKPGGVLSILDYSHSDLEWNPHPPASMKKFYDAFLRWRADAGMNNSIADELEGMFVRAGFMAVEVFDANEVYVQGAENFISRLGIWSKVAGLKQIVEEGYFQESERISVIEEYDQWVVSDAKKMIMKLKEVRGRI
jgi:ubiquinone/menaquinone biosynthesis C-methylase UbiE